MFDSQDDKYKNQNKPQNNIKKNRPMTGFMLDTDNDKNRYHDMFHKDQKAKL